MENLAILLGVLCVYCTIDLGEFVAIPPQDVSRFKGICPDGSVFATNGVHYSCMWCAPYCEKQPSRDCFKFCPDFMKGQGYDVNDDLTVVSFKVNDKTTEIRDDTIEPKSDSGTASTVELIVVIALICVICGAIGGGFLVFIVQKLKRTQPQNTGPRSDSVPNISVDGSSSAPLLAPKSTAQAGTPAPDVIGTSKNDQTRNHVDPTGLSLPRERGTRSELGVKATPQADRYEPSGVTRVQGIQPMHNEETGDYYFTMDSTRPGDITSDNNIHGPPVEHEYNEEHRERSFPNNEMSVGPNSAASQFKLRSQQTP